MRRVVFHERQLYVPAKRHPKDVSCALFSSYKLHKPSTAQNCNSIRRQLRFCLWFLLHVPYPEGFFSIVIQQSAHWTDNSHIARGDSENRVNYCMLPALYSVSSSFSMFIDCYYVLKLSFFTISTLYVFFLFSMNFPISYIAQEIRTYVLVSSFIPNHFWALSQKKNYGRISFCPVLEF